MTDEIQDDETSEAYWLRERKDHENLCAAIIRAGHFPDKDADGKEHVNSDLPRLVGGLIDLLEDAWGVIANAGNPLGCWENLPDDWREAAGRWRDRYHAAVTGKP